MAAEVVDDVEMDENINENLPLDESMDETHSDSGSSNSDLSEDEEVDEARINELKQKVSENPYLYDPHIELIRLLRKSGDLFQLREARENANKIFPLSPELWLEWLTDEAKIASSEEEKIALNNLFERAVKDYMFPPSPDVVSSPEQQEQIKQQTNRIMSIFHRQLSIPLLDMEKTYKEYKEWIDGEIPPSVEQSYNKAKKKLFRLQEFEDSLISSESPHLQEYYNYIEFEEKEKDPARVQCIYERAITDNCLVPDLWQKYTKYLDTQLRIDNIVLTAHERAVRNCPWSVTLWVNYILAMERHKQPHENIKEIIERALQAGFSQADEFRLLWLTYLDYLRRRIKRSQDFDDENDHSIDILRYWARIEAKLCKNMDKARELWNKILSHGHASEAQMWIEYANFERIKAMLWENHQYYQAFEDSFLYDFDDENDHSIDILRYWARIEAKLCKNMDKARELWNKILSHGHASEAQMWIEYANFERAYGDEIHCRKILLKGLHSASDWPEVVGEALLNFEREEGTIETLDIATDKYNSQMKRINERRQKRAEKEQELQRIEEEQKKIAKAEKKAARAEKKAAKAAAKAQQILGKENLKRKESIAEALKNDRLRIEGRPVFISRCEDKKNNPNRNTFKFQTGLEKSKLFVRGLPPSMTVEELEKMFSTYGELKDVRLVTYRNGHSKGLAYVEFADENSASTALEKTNGTEIGTNVISVAISNPPERKPRKLSEKKNAGNKTSSQLSNVLGGGGGSVLGPRGRGRTQLTMVPRALQQSQQVSKTSKQNGESNGTDSESKKLTNDDFRRLLQPN
ncbi:squamous cell carcinoma antigen recognized by T-cells 3-like [Centruroides sculpturatus]|uniref:squamous cell carcinoma antigen recognized by T-cells 3-like n=1 Tax=Centruroides sculpturatus TaxID=218467 RepID=UPI000C6CDE88|nr:squamous cell carcinoma antigen recognized by T-cells 3-like [Centruroides sculpturatus]